MLCWVIYGRSLGGFRGSIHCFQSLGGFVSAIHGVLVLGFALSEKPAGVTSLAAGTREPGGCAP